jgi:hypothetical protein
VYIDGTPRSMSPAIVKVFNSRRMLVVAARTSG